MATSALRFNPHITIDEFEDFSSEAFTATDGRISGSEAAPIDVHWRTAENGVFNSPDNWIGDQAPGSADTAILDAGGTLYTVTVTSNQVVGALETTANATLEIAHGTFTEENGTADGVSAGEIIVDAGADLDLSGVLRNTGVVVVNGTLNCSTNSATVFDGTVKLETAGAKVEATAGAQVELNATVVNNGVLAADGGLLAVIGTVTGTGSAQIKGGELFVVGPFVQNVAFSGRTGELVLAEAQTYTGTISGFAANGVMSLYLEDIPFDPRTKVTFFDNSTSTAGILRVSVTASIARFTLKGDYANAIFSIAEGVNGGTVVTATMPASAPIHWRAAVSGAFSNAANWSGGSVPGPGDVAELDAVGANFTVTTTGDVSVVSLQTAVNATLAVGAGVFSVADGAGRGTNAGDVIAGEGATFAATGMIANGGSLVATTGGLILLGDPTDAGSTTLAGAGGSVISAAGGTIELMHTTIEGGSLGTSNGGVIVCVLATGDPNNELLDGAGGHPVTLDGTLNIVKDAIQVIDGSIINEGEINVEGGLLAVENGGATLTGDGAINLSGGFGIESGTDGSETLTNVDNTLDGSGSIGLVGEPLIFLNDSAGVVDANASGTLTIDTLGPTAVNDGLFEATGSGNLVIDATTVNQLGHGVILAGDRSTVGLEKADVIGGALATAGSGMITTVGRGAVLDGRLGTISLEGRLNVLNGDDLRIDGAVGLTGFLHVLGNTRATILRVSGTGAQVSGAGRILFDGADCQIGGVSTISTFADSGQIFGRGALEVLQLTFTNAGLLASRSGEAFTIDLDGGSSLVNQGRLMGFGSGGATTVQGGVQNDGKLVAFHGGLNIEGAVTGAGVASIIGGGVLSLGAAFTQDVHFVKGAASGELVLAQSQSYTGVVFNFAATAATSLDLKDIAFASAGEATFAKGVLTVSDGTNTAHIRLTGSFAGDAFTATSDGAGGVIVTAGPAAAVLAQAMAGMAPTAAAEGHAPPVDVGSAHVTLTAPAH